MDVGWDDSEWHTCTAGNASREYLSNALGATDNIPAWLKYDAGMILFIAKKINSMQYAREMLESSTR